MYYKGQDMNVGAQSSAMVHQAKIGMTVSSDVIGSIGNIIRLESIRNVMILSQLPTDKTVFSILIRQVGGRMGGVLLEELQLN